MNKVKKEDFPKMHRLMILDMKQYVPIQLTKEERDEHSDLVVEFNSKYPTWQKGFNFVTGELLE